MTPMGPSSSCYTCFCMLVADTMLSTRLLFLLLLIPGTWADPEGKWETWLTPPCSYPPH